jgi:hypothetical protein
VITIDRLIIQFLIARDLCFYKFLIIGFLWVMPQKVVDVYFNYKDLFGKHIVVVLLGKCPPFALCGQYVERGITAHLIVLSCLSLS